MGSEVDWKALLKGKYPSCKIEVDAYLDSLEISTSNEVSARKCYEAICDHPEVSETLKMLYKEGLFGTNKDVRARIKSRMSTFRRNLRWAWSVGLFDFLAKSIVEMLNLSYICS